MMESVIKSRIELVSTQNSGELKTEAAFHNIKLYIKLNK